MKDDALNICRNIAPKLTGNTAYNGIIKIDTHNGFEIRMLESVTPYGIGLDDATGGWAKIHKGFFSTRSNNAVLSYISGKGGNFDSMNVTKEHVENLARDNPARQQVYIKNLLKNQVIEEE
jgi:hypothetical protein